VLLPPPPPPQQLPKPPEGITKTGVPYHQRGRIGLDTGGCLSSDGRTCGAVVNLVATLPLTDKLMFEGVVPLVVPNRDQSGAVGNAEVAVHYVGRVMKRMWITGGGRLGVPLIDQNEFQFGSFPKAFWRAHQYVHQILPITFVLGWEMHVNIVELRAELEPSLWLPIGNRDDIEGALYHSFEVQIGHSFGGGLRLQGVVVGPGNDNYQAALQPFFAVEQELGYLRTGPMMPLDEQLGPPFEQGWGFLLEAGVRLE